MQNKGPLTLLTQALFGDGSFFTATDTSPVAYQDGNGYGCVGFQPLQRFMSGSDCLSIDDYANGTQIPITRQYANWLYSFTDTDRMQTAFSAAIYLASEVWLINGPITKDLQINSDPGIDMQKPQISTEGIIVVSAMMGAFLLSLWAVALWANRTPTWTSELDAFAMLRIGAVLGESKIPLRVVDYQSRVRALDEISGFVGDSKHGTDGIGELTVGNVTPAFPMRRGRKYRSYGKSKLYSWSSFANWWHRERTRPPPTRRVYRAPTPTQ